MAAEALRVAVVERLAALHSRPFPAYPRVGRRDDGLADGVLLFPDVGKRLHVLHNRLELRGRDVPTHHRRAVEVTADEPHQVRVAGQLLVEHPSEFELPLRQVSRRRTHPGRRRAAAIAFLPVTGSAVLEVGQASGVEDLRRHDFAGQLTGRGEFLVCPLTTGGKKQDGDGEAEQAHVSSSKPRRATGTWPAKPRK